LAIDVACFNARRGSRGDPPSLLYRIAGATNRGAAKQRGFARGLGDPLRIRSRLRRSSCIFRQALARFQESPSSSMISKRSRGRAGGRPGFLLPVLHRRSAGSASRRNSGSKSACGSGRGHDPLCRPGHGVTPHVEKSARPSRFAIFMTTGFGAKVGRVRGPSRLRTSVRPRRSSSVMRCMTFAPCFTGL